MAQGLDNREFSKAAFIGLGVMGYPMAGHLAKNGFAVTVYNRTDSKAQKWVEEYGGKSASTPALAAAEVLALLAATIGAAFFALSTNSSLVQHWWSKSGFRSSDDPYWLYGASNLGSLIALLAYPFVIEPALGLEAQTGLWTAAYVLYAGLTLMAGARALRAEASTAL